MFLQVQVLCFDSLCQHIRTYYIYSHSFYSPFPQGYKINMTAPVTMMEEPVDDVSNKYQMCFYIPAAHQLEPPMPTDTEVYIEVRPRLTVATR